MDIVEVTKEFVSHNSASQLSNASVTKAIARWMRKVGMKVEVLEYLDAQGVLKTCAIGKKGQGTGGLAMMGHCDVVPADGWATDPFKGVVKKGRLYGRGSADMKGSIACMLATVEAFSQKDLTRPIYVITTSDEEINCRGALEVFRRSKTVRSSKIRYGIVGEPTMLDVVHAHKGSGKIEAVAKGRAAHSSTGKGINANHRMVPFLNDLLQLAREVEADPAYRDEAFRPPHTCWNVVMGDGETASNMTAPESRATINCRPMGEQDMAPVWDKARRLAKSHGVQIKIYDSLKPLATPVESRVVQEALRITGKRKAKTVAYGTDGMIFGKGMELVVMGPGDIQQAHTADEWIEVDQLHKGVEVFTQMVRRFCIEDPE